MEAPVPEQAPEPIAIKPPRPLWKRILRPFVLRARALTTLRGLVGERRWNRWQRGVALEPDPVPGGRLLELGCASGERLASLRALGWQHLYGVELVPAAAARARAAGFEVICGSAEDPLESFPDAHFDVIIASMVLEHLANPFAVVDAIARKLKPGGQFLFSTVVHDSADGVLFGSYWSGFDFPRHLVFFRRADLRKFLSRDFERVAMYHQSAPIDYVRSARWRNGWLDRRIEKLFSSPRGFSVASVLAWLRLTCRVSVTARRKGSSAGIGAVAR